MNQNNIKPQELRLGNYIKADDNIICQVANIESNEFTKWDSGDDYSIVAKEVGTNDNYLNCLNDNWQPIPLSEEVLLKAGFEKEEDDDDRFVFNNDIVDYIIDTDIEGSFLIGVRSISDINYFSWEIKHLHQLQNLFYAITNSELRIDGSAF